MRRSVIRFTPTPHVPAAPAAFARVPAVISFVAFAFSSLFAVTAHGQMSGMSAMHGSSGAAAASNGAAPTSTDAFRQAEQTMMGRMSSSYSGNTDQDFVSHMEPHHEGAIAMAEVELKYGKDPTLKRLARNIIDAQRREIAFMKQWQAKHPMR